MRFLTPSLLIPNLFQGVLMILGQADTSWNNMKKFLVSRSGWTPCLATYDTL